MVEEKKKTAFLFPGQGSQYVGMGKDFYDLFPAAREIYNQANDVLGFDITELCFFGKQEELNKTSVCQPAILVTSIAILEVLKKKDSSIIGSCHAAAGLSLGEYTAHVSAGSIPFAEAVRLVYKRGIFMQEACTAHPGGMVSVIGLEGEKVEQICDELKFLGTICAANYNSPGQVVISGEKAVLEKASILAKERGAKVVVPLKVDGAFHSALMSPASKNLINELQSTTIKKPKVPVVANIHAQFVQEPGEIKESLAKQLNSPVRWSQSMMMLIREGFEQFYEIGPGKSLSGLMKRIDSSKAVRNIGVLEDLNK